MDKIEDIRRRGRAGESVFGEGWNPKAYLSDASLCIAGITSPTRESSFAIRNVSGTLGT
ncbi:MAG: hypothetical protein Q4B45_07430 [Coriobacteriia bacterium]|nr:hypothetical protein [Coriobacteriia bacterium]